jgi:hypothetical protein
LLDAHYLEFARDPSFHTLISRYPKIRLPLQAGRHEYFVQDEILPRDVEGDIYWRFIGENRCGVTTTTEARHLCIGEPPDPVAFSLAPVNAVQRGPTVLLRPGLPDGWGHTWYDPLDPRKTHVFEISDTATFVQLIHRIGDHSDDGQEPALQPSGYPLRFEPGQDYFVRERVTTGCGETVTAPVAVHVQQGFCPADTELSFTDDGRAIIAFDVESTERIVPGGLEVELDFEHPVVGEIVARLRHDGTYVLELLRGEYFGCQMGRSRLLHSQVANFVGAEWDGDWQARSCPNSEADKLELIRVYGMEPSTDRRVGGRWELEFSTYHERGLEGLKVNRLCLFANSKPAPARVFQDGFEGL